LNDRKIVIVLDRLGTKGIWLRESHNTTLQKYCELIDEINKIKEQFGKDFRNFAETTQPDIRTIFFSDTLILINEVIEELQTLSYVAWIACNIIVEGIKRNIFFRGAMSIGDVYYKEGYNVVLGPAIDEVTDWYERSEWIGMHCAPSMHYLVEKHSTDATFKSIQFLLKYKVPIKDNPNFNGWAINWPMLHIENELNKGVFDECKTLEEAREAAVRLVKNPDYKDNKHKVIREVTNWLNDKFSQSVTDYKNFQKFENTMQFYYYAVTQ